MKHTGPVFLGHPVHPMPYFAVIVSNITFPSHMVCVNLQPFRRYEVLKLMMLQKHSKVQHIGKGGGRTEAETGRGQGRDKRERRGKEKGMRRGDGGRGEWVGRKRKGEGEIGKGILPRFCRDTVRVNLYRNDDPTVAKPVTDLDDNLFATVLNNILVCARPVASPHSRGLFPLLPYPVSLLSPLSPSSPTPPLFFPPLSSPPLRSRNHAFNLHC